MMNLFEAVFVVENDEYASCWDYADLELVKPIQQVETHFLRDVDANTISGLVEMARLMR